MQWSWLEDIYKKSQAKPENPVSKQNMIIWLCSYVAINYNRPFIKSD